MSHRRVVTRRRMRKFGSSQEPYICKKDPRVPEIIGLCTKVMGFKTQGSQTY